MKESPVPEKTPLGKESRVEEKISLQESRVAFTESPVPEKRVLGKESRIAVEEKRPLKESPVPEKRGIESFRKRWVPKRWVRESGDQDFVRFRESVEEILQSIAFDGRSALYSQVKVLEHSMKEVMVEMNRSIAMREEVVDLFASLVVGETLENRVLQRNLEELQKRVEVVEELGKEDAVFHLLECEKRKVEVVGKEWMRERIQDAVVEKNKGLQKKVEQLEVKVEGLEERTKVVEERNRVLEENNRVLAEVNQNILRLLEEESPASEALLEVNKNLIQHLGNL